MQINSLPLVLIKWDDIVTESAGWFPLEVIDDLTHQNCFSVGWLVKEDSLNYYVIQTFGEHKGVWEGSGDITIPKGCVRAIKILLNENWMGSVATELIH